MSARPEDFNDQGKHERLIRELENAANSISDEVFHYWSQNRDLSVDLKVLPAEEVPVLADEEVPAVHPEPDRYYHEQYADRDGGRAVPDR